jgi:isoquinoline 1-oxidoreductase beta subunit
MTSVTDRRGFIQLMATAGGGLLLGVQLFPRARFSPEAGEAEPWRPNVWLAIDEAGLVTVTVARAEMGQGVRTAIPMLVAEELEADWTRIRVVQGDLDPRYGEQFAGGSAVMRTSWEPLRKAGAAAREMLVAAAAASWSVPAAECVARQGAIHHEGSRRRLDYGDLVELARRRPVPVAPRLKAPAEYRIIGRPTRNLDTPAIVNGSAPFGIDVRLPGMLYAVIERSPVFGGTIGSVDDSAALAIPGVVAVVPINADAVPEFEGNNPKMVSGVAVVARSTWAALQGRRALRVRWIDGDGASESTAAMRERCIAAAGGADRFSGTYGDNVDAQLAGSARRIESVYETQLLAHAPMEPMNCTALIRNGQGEIWAPCQNPVYARTAATRITGLPPAAITVHVTRMGGAFGRRFYVDYVAEAVYVSHAISQPVQVLWTREDDMRHGFYRPAGYHLLRGAINAAGEPVAWEHRLINASRGHHLKWRPAGDRYNPGELSLDDYPGLPAASLRLGYSPIDSPIPRGQWRAVESSSLVFVSQSFMDELAHLAGQDPLEFRLALLRRYPAPLRANARYDAERLANVLGHAARLAGWGTPMAPGKGRGIASHWGNETYVAHVAEVSVSDDGAIKVDRVVSAVDCGQVINPRGAEAQVAGSIVDGLGAMLRQEITVESGRVVQGNFGDYPLITMREMPSIETHFIASSAPIGGMGEPALPPLAPAVANAIFAASGRRIRKLPL